MKKTLILVVALIFVVGVAGMAMAGITGSPHDFTVGGGQYNVQTGEICKACHAPHAADTDFDSLLWNHTPSVAVYDMYASSTIDGAGSTVDGHSKLCLTCHDGTIAVNSFPDETGAAASLTGSFVIAVGGTDLRGSHPISITYDTIDAGLADPISTLMNGTIPLNELLPADKIQCSTCHDVHNNTSVFPTETAAAPLLRASNAASALCLTCHLK